MRAWLRGGAAEGRPHELIQLVTRLTAAQVVAAGAIGLPFSRRQLSSILITLGLVATLCVLTVVVHSGTRSAWLAAIVFETALFVYGLTKFVVARYVGGTLFALIIAGALAHPAVARAYSVHLRRAQGPLPAEESLGEAAGETLGGRTAG